MFSWVLLVILVADVADVILVAPTLGLPLRASSLSALVTPLYAVYAKLFVFFSSTDFFISSEK